MSIWPPWRGLRDRPPDALPPVPRRRTCVCAAPTSRPAWPAGRLVPATTRCHASAPLISALQSHHLHPIFAAICGRAATKSCECFRRCREYFCPKAPLPNTVLAVGRLVRVPPDVEQRQSTGCRPFHPMPPPLHAVPPLPPPPPPPPALPSGVVPHLDRGCYEWEGVPPDEQYSRVPEPEEEAKVKCYDSYDKEKAKEIPCRCGAGAARHWGRPGGADPPGRAPPRSDGACVPCRWACAAACSRLLGAARRHGGRSPPAAAAAAAGAALVVQVSASTAPSPPLPRRRRPPLQRGNEVSGS